MILKFYKPLRNPFDNKDVATALKSLEKSIGLSITIHDMRGILSDEKGNFLFPNHQRHEHPYCTFGRYTKNEWNSKCVEHCQWHIEKIASKNNLPFLHRCWKGCAELVVPVIQNGTLLMILYAGVFKFGHFKLSKNLKHALGKHYDSLPEFTDEDLKTLKDILSLTGEGILSYVLQPKKGDVQNSTRKGIILQYLEENVHREASLQGLARHLYLSVSRTRHIISECFNMSFSEMLLRERMKRARNLLLSGDMRLQEITTRVGMTNVYYFNRCFSRFYGTPPSKYRKLQNKNS